ATCTDGLVQGGWAQEALTGTDHAMIWRGSASSSLDLHPSGYVSSQVHGLSGSLQVGSATTIDGEFEHAIIWSGTAESAHDLHSYLPAGFSHSTAYAVAPDGTVVGVAYDGSFFRHAVMWKPVQ
ncbi:MAG TPA: hypothetical protein VEX38_04335, partial [Fimbriimonadaceae bacterium]|nr:hypothetical protein [Fimbriimonadaceae bacterium]